MARYPALVRMRGVLAILGFALLLAACGGGGGGGGSSSMSNVVASFPASPASLSDSNVAAITVEKLVGNSNVNIPYVTVRVCIPGTNTCKDIDHVLVDTGSTGLRLFASQLNASPALALPPHSIGSSSTISECAQFLNNLAWGTVNLADVVMGGERAPNVPIQLMNAGYASVPSNCGNAALLTTSTDVISDPAVRANTDTLPANGILGVGLFAHDGQQYFNCASPSNSCEMTAVASNYPVAAQQVQNPVGLFTSGNNNGVVISLPSVGSTGATIAQGYLIFGIGTQANNRLGPANVVPVNSHGFFITNYRNYSYSGGFMDSGSNGLFFTEPPITPLLSGTCSYASSDFYCPPSTRNLTADIHLAASLATVSFSIASADTLFLANGRNNFAFNNLGGTLSTGYFDWGLPFFFGRSVYTAIEGRQVITGAAPLTGPFNAFTN